MCVCVCVCAPTYTWRSEDNPGCPPLSTLLLWQCLSYCSICQASPCASGDLASASCLPAGVYKLLLLTQVGSGDLNSGGQDSLMEPYLSTLSCFISNSHSRGTFKNSMYFIWISNNGSFSLFSIPRSSWRTITNEFNLRPPISQQKCLQR